MKVTDTSLDGCVGKDHWGLPLFPKDIVVVINRRGSSRVGASERMILGFDAARDCIVTGPPNGDKGRVGYLTGYSPLIFKKPVT